MFSVKYRLLLPFVFLAGLVGSTASTASAEKPRDTSFNTAIDWSGLYAGVHGGYGWSGIDTNLGGVNVDGWLGGGHVGLQRQFDRWVVGIEASYSFGELDGSRTIPFGGDPLRLDAAISDLLLVTGRLGYAWNDRLVYIKAGYAAADVEVGTTYLGQTTTAKSRLDGLTAGFGLERMLTANIAIGLEYNYIDLGAKSIAAAAPPVILAAVVVPPQPKLSKPAPDEIHTVFARLTYRFGGSAAEHVPDK